MLTTIANENSNRDDRLRTPQTNKCPIPQNKTARDQADAAQVERDLCSRSTPGATAAGAGRDGAVCIGGKMQMSTRQQIVLAVANGCRNTREIAARLGCSHSHISNYFWPFQPCTEAPLINGDILQWTPGLTNTLRLVDGILCHRNSAGRVVGVYGRIECKTATPLTET